METNNIIYKRKLLYGYGWYYRDMNTIIYGYEYYYTTHSLFIEIFHETNIICINTL